MVSNKRVFIAILGAYFLTIPDVTAKVIGMITLAGSLSGFLFEIPSGYASDKLGHKKTIILSFTLLFFSTLLFILAKNTFLLVLGSVFLSAGHAFISGTGSAFMHETLRSLGREGDYSKVMGKASAIGFAIPAALAVFIPFLVGISYKLPFIVSLVIDTVGLISAISLVTPMVSQEETEEIRVTNFRQVLQEATKLNYFSVALFSGIVGGTLFAIGAFRAPYQVFLEIPVIWYGVFFGLGRGLASMMLYFSGRIKKFLTMLSFFRIQLVLYIVFMAILAITSDARIIVAVFIIVNAFFWGLSKIDEGYQLEVIKSSKFKATLLSVGKQIEHVATAFFSFVLGVLIERLSYQYGFLLLGVLFFSALLPVYFYVARKYRKGLYQNTQHLY